MIPGIHMKTSEKLIERLNRDLNLKIPTAQKPRRLRHGWNARSSGAWSWAIGGNEQFIHSYGSQWSMTEVVSAKYITTFREWGHDISILVVDEKEYNEWLKEQA